MAKFIAQILALLLCWSFIGVVGAVAIVAAQSTSVGVAGAIGWIAFCSIGYLLCIDLLIAGRGRRHG